MSTNWKAPRGSNWKSSLTGTAIPVCVWLFFFGVVLVSIVSDAQRMVEDGASLEFLLRLARAGLTCAFMALLAMAYVVRIRTTERAEGFWERIFPMLVFVTSIVGTGILHSRPGSPNFYMTGAGIFLAPLGLCLSIWSVWHLRSSISIMAEARRTVVSGPYRHVRHPLYLGEILTLLGVCLLIGTLVALLFWAVISASQLARARIEERKLSRALPEYESYRRKTPFIIPKFLMPSR